MDQKEKPVILDCYADWCAPCRKLTPELEKKTIEHEGKFKLVKMNIESIPQLTKGLNVKAVPTLFLIYRGNIMDTLTGADSTKIDGMIDTALLIEKTSHDETIMVKVLKEAESMIEDGSYQNAKQILEDGSTYDQWRDKFGADLLTGIAYCQLMLDKDTIAARQTLSPLTEAQIKDMDENSYFGLLIFKVDEEIQRLEELAKPDNAQIELQKKVEAEPENLGNYFALALLLISKNRNEEAIPYLLDIITIERNWSEKKAYNKLMEVFAKLGSTNDAVKKGRSKLANIMF